MMLLSSLLAVVGTAGKLFVVGGGSTSPELVERFIKECGGENALIIVLPLATAKPDDTRTKSVDFLKKHGAKNVFLFSKTAPTPEQLKELKVKLDECKGIWMPGGDQSWIVRHLGKAWIDENVKPLLKKGVHFYGTSAGAMVCSDPMITGNGDQPETAKTGAGIGLTTWLIDSHTAQRKREPRLRYAMKQVGAKKGLGLNEKEWCVIQDDKIIETHGTPTVIDLEKAGLLVAVSRWMLLAPLPRVLHDRLEVGILRLPTPVSPDLLAANN